MSHVPPRLTFTMELRVRVDPPIEVGNVGRGRRRIVPIRGGMFEGPRLRGQVLDGGADWQVVHEDGLTELDTRYTLRTDSGALIYIQNAGLRHAIPEVAARLLAGEQVDPGAVYFRTTPRFETPAAELQWLRRHLFIGDGERYPGEVVVRVWAVE